MIRAAFDGHHLPGGDLPDVPRLEHLQRAGLRRDEHLTFLRAHYERPKSVRIPHGVQLLLVHEKEAVCPLDAGEALDERFAEGRLPRAGHQVQEQLRVGRALEDRAFVDELPLQLLRVRDVAVVRKGDLTLAARDNDGLGVGQLVRPLCGIAHVTDADPGGVFVRQVVGEGIGHHADAPVRLDPPVAVVGEAGALLAPVLQGEQAVEEELGDVDFGVGGDAHDPAVVAKGIARVFHGGMKHERGGSVNRASLTPAR